MKFYWNIYKEFINTNISEASSFRLSFILIILLDLVFYLSALGTVHVIYDHVEAIGPWNKNQLMFFTAFMLCVDHLHMALISESFWRLSADIRMGNLDFILLKPVHSLFTVFFRYIRPSALFNAFIIWGTTIYFGLQIPLSALSWVLLPFFIILSFSLLAILEFIISASMFWITEGIGINFLRMQIQQLSRWPDFIYQYFTRKTFTIAIPILLIGSAPVHFLYDPRQWEYLLGLFVALVVSLLVLLKVWSLALNRYESASS